MATTVSHPSELLSESESKRLRAYEGLVVILVVIAAVLAVVCTAAVVLYSRLGDVTHALPPGA
jgi:hypothetical protein